MPYKNRNDPRQKQSARRYYERNKSAYLARNLEKKQKIKLWVQAQKDQPCMDCGQSFPHYVMDFDHRADEIKLYEPTRLYTLQSWTKVKGELAKCDLVCANCHRERTFGSRPDVQEQKSRD